LAGEPVGNASAEADAFFNQELQRWKQVIDAAGISLSADDFSGGEGDSLHVDCCFGQARASCGICVRRLARWFHRVPGAGFKSDLDRAANQRAAGQCGQPPDPARARSHHRDLRPDLSKRFAGNNLACSNCHLEAGAKKFGIALFGAFGEFPGYSARAGAEITIEDRLNSCMLRSMNGRALPVRSPQMQALVAYVKFLSTGAPPGRVLPGLGVGKMPELDRAADPVRGQALYASTCAACHNTDGSGIRRSLPSTDLGYMVPPLWGSDSFNDGAGMARLITAANFIHFNMPHGADYLNPQLSPEQAWDIAAYMVSQPRPRKAGLDKDFPDLLEKPVDVPYGPYGDGFSEQQHKYGPFAPIRAAIAKLKSERAASGR
jgi:thiosulfate dehydrogenase